MEKDLAEEVVEEDSKVDREVVDRGADRKVPELLVDHRTVVVEATITWGNRSKYRKTRFFLVNNLYLSFNLVVREAVLKAMR